jgi:hypothetical protein
LLVSVRYPAEARRFPEQEDRRPLRRAGKIETKTGSLSIAKARRFGQACLGVSPKEVHSTLPIPSMMPVKLKTQQNK